MENTTNPLLRDIDAVIFDYGGTLDVPGHHHWSHIIQQGWEKAGLDIDRQTFRDAYVHAERTLARQYTIYPQDNFRTLMDKKIAIEMDYLVQHRAITPSQAAACTPVIAAYCDDSGRRAVDNARPVLEALAVRVPLVLVSNFYGNVDSVLRTYGIRHLFAGIIESAVTGVRKPDSRLFAMGVIAGGAPACRTLVVGDSLRKDILPARSLGCPTAWLKGRGWTPDEDLATDPAQIPSLEALMP